MPRAVVFSYYDHVVLSKETKMVYLKVTPRIVIGSTDPDLSIKKKTKKKNKKSQFLVVRV